jgi:superfamily I DNA/RNA helicase
VNPFQRAREEALAARSKLLGPWANKAVHVKEFLTTEALEKAFKLSILRVHRDTSELPTGDANLRREDDAIYVWIKKGEQDAAYLVAHELGHFHLDDEKAAETLADLAKALAPEGSTKACVSIESYGARERNELRANVFARELLLPRAIARELHAKGMGPSEAAAKYGIHPEVVRQQMLDGVLLPVVTKPSEPKPVHPLTPDQEAAAHAAERHANVIAGPGSGKTKTLVDRVRYLIEVKEIEPRHILVLTFTNKAAFELVDRLRDAGIQRASDIWAGTFHAFGLEFIRKYHQHFGLENDVAVLDKLGSLVMLNRDLPNVTLKYYKRLQDPYDWLPKVVEAIKRLKEEMLTPADYRERMGKLPLGGDPQVALRREDVATLFERHELLLSKRRMVDFVDLVAKPAARLNEDRAKYSELGDRFEHILVDEYQDVTQAMVQLIIQLADKKRSIWVVGDVRQAIHHWRGASVQSLRKFGATFAKHGDSPSLKSYGLKFNRRSTPQIVELVDQVGTRHVLQDEPHLKLVAAKATSADGPKPRLFSCRPASSMPDAIAQQIQTSKHTFSHHAVLSRANYEVERLAVQLRERGIPTLYIGELAQRPEVKVLLCLMHLLIERTPRTLVGLLSVPGYAIDSDDIATLMNACAGDPTLQLGKWMEKPPSGLSKKTLDVIERVRTLVGDHKLSSTPWEFVCDMLLERRFGYPPSTDHSVEAHTARIGLWQFAYSTRIGDGEKRVVSLVRFLRRQQLRRRIDETYPERELPAEAAAINAVRMMSVHGSKGLEFEVVHLANIKDDDYGEHGGKWRGLPDLLTIVPPEVLGSSLEEWELEAATERNNLLYVAVSRAQRDLVMYQNGEEPKKLVSQLNGSPTACLIKNFVGDSEALKPLPPASGSALPSMPLGEFEVYARCPLQHWYRYRLELPPESFTDVSFRARLAVMEALQACAKSGESAEATLESAWERRKLPYQSEDPQLYEQASAMVEMGVDLIEASDGQYSEGTAVVNGLELELPWVLRTSGHVARLEVLEFSFSDPKGRDATWRPILSGLRPSGGRGATIHSLLNGASHDAKPNRDVTLTGMSKAVDRFRRGVQEATPGKQCRYCAYAVVCPSRPEP